MVNKKGIYCIVFRNNRAEIETGSLGNIVFECGWHIYVGSALGNAGYKRVERHRRLADSKDKKPKWHVDYLLINYFFSLEYIVFLETTDRLECSLARALGGVSIPGFGSSDCRCDSHLFHREVNPLNEIKSAFLSICPGIDEKCLIICCM